ncbi:MAG: prepilin-type N-terminal cleavage/methylation domain-containing protein [Lachnospiraceae bacterium]|nr:prepilin-type N-terminal cleavage/methylation domain-containing protein [Lachnospiraceae bacterium]
MKKMNNKGFSLVELIVVIAIMAVLVGVLAPQFIKYVESSRRSTDISNAQNIQSAVLADIANGKLTQSGAGEQHTTLTATGSGTNITSISEVIKTKGNPAGVDSDFSITYNCDAGTCHVSVGSYDLTTTSGAKDYKEYNQ